MGNVNLVELVGRGHLGLLGQVLDLGLVKDDGCRRLVFCIRLAFGSQTRCSAFPLLTLAWDMTRSFSSTPLVSTTSSSSIMGAGPAAASAAWGTLTLLNFSAAAICAYWDKSSIWALPKTMKVSSLFPIICELLLSQEMTISVELQGQPERTFNI